VNGDVPAIRLAERARISYRQLDYWTRAGYVHTAPREPGQGHPRLYGHDEVFVALVLAALVHAGVQLDAAGPAARRSIVRTEPDGTTFATMLDGLAVYGYLP
jgi:hypothetical protein